VNVNRIFHQHTVNKIRVNKRSALGKCFAMHLDSIVIRIGDAGWIPQHCSDLVLVHALLQTMSSVDACIWRGSRHRSNTGLRAR
jgi:hypothetical protein